MRTVPIRSHPRWPVDVLLQSVVDTVDATETESVELHRGNLTLSNRQDRVGAEAVVILRVHV